MGNLYQYRFKMSKKIVFIKKIIAFIRIILIIELQGEVEKG